MLAWSEQLTTVATEYEDDKKNNKNEAPRLFSMNLIYAAVQSLNVTNVVLG